MNRTPKICWHKGQCRWYVTIAGREIYLSGRTKKGKGPPAEVRRRADKLVGDYLAERGRPVARAGTDPTVDELWAAYRAHLEQLPREVRHREREGAASSDFGNNVRACRVAARLYGQTPARDFTPSRFREVRAALGSSKSAVYVNAQAARVKRMFAWGVAGELVPASVLEGLRAVRGVGEDDGYERSAPVADVPDSAIEATLPYLPGTLADLVRAHRLIGCRAREICILRPGDLARHPDPESATGELWTYTPDPAVARKTRPTHWVGPRAQALLKPLLEGLAAGAWVFPRPRAKAGRWDTRSYQKAVAAACAREKLAHWSPLQVRHRAAEEARQEHPAGLEATQARLRHKHLDVSERYAHQLDQLGKDVARRLG